MKASCALRGVCTILDAHGDGGEGETQRAQRADSVDAAQGVDRGQLAQAQLHGAEDDDEVLQSHAAIRLVERVDGLLRQKWVLKNTQGMVNDCPGDGDYTHYASTLDCGNNSTYSQCSQRRFTIIV